MTSTWLGDTPEQTGDLTDARERLAFDGHVIAVSLRIAQHGRRVPLHVVLGDHVLVVLDPRPARDALARDGPLDLRLVEQHTTIRIALVLRDEEDATSQFLGVGPRAALLVRVFVGTHEIEQTKRLGQLADRRRIRLGAIKND